MNQNFYPIGISLLFVLLENESNCNCISQKSFILCIGKIYSLKVTLKYRKKIAFSLITDLHQAKNKQILDVLSHIKRRCWSYTRTTTHLNTSIWCSRGGKHWTRKCVMQKRQKTNLRIIQSQQQGHWILVKMHEI